IRHCNIYRGSGWWKDFKQYCDDWIWLVQ
ncbi:alpha 1,3-glucosidase, partial [Fistulifera solaris]